MKRFINMGSIEQYRTIIKNIKFSAQYIGQDEDDNPIYDRSAILPTIVATGSEKIHGTNMAVCYSESDGFWVQSRKNIITTEKDNAACAFNAHANQYHWIEIIKNLSLFHNIDLTKNIISVYAEWAGGNIQKLSALTGESKKAIVFHYFKVSPLEPVSDDEVEDNAYWLSTNKEDNPEHGIYNIMNFNTFQLEINFNEALLSQNSMIDLVLNEIEPNSPVAKFFDLEGNVGEGIVFTFEYKSNIYKFKIKGEKHSASKVKTLKPVDNAKEQSKIDFTNYAVTSSRLEQAWQLVFGIGNEITEPDISQTGTFLRAIVNDVHKEESDILLSINLEPKDVNAMISTLARRWFMEELDRLV